MAKEDYTSRRQVLGSGGALLMASALHDRSLAATRPAHRNGTLLAGEFTVAAAIPTPDFYIHDPGMALLPSGHLFVAAPIRRRHEAELPEGGPSPQATSIMLSRSEDRGATWKQLPPLPVYRDATPFVHRGALHLLIPHYAEEKILLMRSDDEGQTWTSPATVIERRLWNCQTAMATREGRLYWAFTTYPGGNALVGASADLDGDLLNAKSWRVSTGCDLPAVPTSMKMGSINERPTKWHRPWSADTWLEPNVIKVNGRLRVLSRVVTGDFSTVGLAAVCELDDSRGDLRMNFCQFHPLPGGQCKFFILHDDRSKLFWMLSNIPTDSQDLYNRKKELIESGFVAGPGNERRILVLHYGRDGLNWFPAGVVAMWPSPLQAFMYPSAAIDGNDIVFISRTSQQAPNQHDADIVTFHRIQNFRSLAVEL